MSCIGCCCKTDFQDNLTLAENVARNHQKQFWAKVGRIVGPVLALLAGIFGALGYLSLGAAITLGCVGCAWLVFSIFALMFLQETIADKLHDLAERKNVKALKEMLDAGADPNAIDSSGEPLLHVAIHREMLSENREMVKLLLSTPGIDVSIRSRSGKDAKEFAKQSAEDYNTILRGLSDGSTYQEKLIKQEDVDALCAAIDAKKNKPN